MATFHCWRLEQLWSWNFSFCNGKPVSKANTTSQAISLAKYFPFLDHLTTDSENAQSNTFILIVPLTLVVRGLEMSLAVQTKREYQKKKAKEKGFPNPPQVGARDTCTPSVHAKAAHWLMLPKLTPWPSYQPSMGSLNKPTTRPEHFWFSHFYKVAQTFFFWYVQPSARNFLVCANMCKEVQTFLVYANICWEAQTFLFCANICKEAWTYSCNANIYCANLFIPSKHFYVL